MREEGWTEVWHTLEGRVLTISKCRACITTSLETFYMHGLKTSERDVDVYQAVSPRHTRR